MSVNEDLLTQAQALAKSDPGKAEGIYKQILGVSSL